MMNVDQITLLQDELKQLQSRARRVETIWQLFSKKLIEHHASFDEHVLFFTALFPNWKKMPWLAPILPEQPCALTILLNQFSIQSVQEFHQWSCQHPELFWELIIKTVDVQFKTKANGMIKHPIDVKHPHWLPGAEFNIVDTCFLANSDKIAIVDVDCNNQLRFTSYQTLLTLTNQIANTIQQLGFGHGDGIAVSMPMHMESVAIYLAIIKCGAHVVSIADSFSPEEITQRLNITQTKLIFTQDVTLWGEKLLPLYEKFSGSETKIVLSWEKNNSLQLKENDFWFNKILDKNTQFSSYPANSNTMCNILFSSGTTAAPKAIPWYHSTPLKVVSDALLHHNLSSTDVLCWPSNIGWMMGPWSIFASLIHRGTLALYPKGAKGRDFGMFVEQVNVTVLGVVPSLVAQWKSNHCMENLNWNCIRLFTSTGECSTPQDMFYLSYLAHYKPIIEYCGGTEIGGAYISSTLAQPNYLSTFTTPTMGLNFIIVNENDIDNAGEVAIVPPSIGLSDALLNGDHDSHYYHNMPVFKDYPSLRRHGDAIQKTENGYFILHGRTDDSMNLGGIKISSIEIERVLKSFSSIKELAAIAVQLESDRREQLIIVVSSTQDLATFELKKQFQTILNEKLNPLFKIHDVVIVDELPKTASNKVMRRLLRTQYRHVS